MVFRRSATQRDGFATASPATKGLVSSLLDSVSALVSVCARQARRLAPPRKALLGGSRPKNKAAPEFLQPMRDATAAAAAMEEGEKGRSGWESAGREGVWQREILMGDRCQPLQFSGVIYYDNTGKQLSEWPPRSPRLPLPHG